MGHWQRNIRACILISPANAEKHYYRRRRHFRGPWRCHRVFIKATEIYFV